MTAGEYVTKKRYLWQVNALRLLREKTCAQYAHRVVPGVIDGVRIQFPEPEIFLGVRVAVRTRRLEGRALFEMLYEPAMGDVAVRIGAIALQALHSADVSSAPFALFSRVYQPVRALKVAVNEMLSSPLLSPAQRTALRRLVADYAGDRGGKRVLVHGDLHPSHLIVDLAHHSLGLIDLEAMRIGKAATNFAQLWIGFHFAHPELGQRLYQRYAEQSPALLDARFDTDVRAELALRSYSHIQEGRRLGKREMEQKARILLDQVLAGASFEQICFQG